MIFFLLVGHLNLLIVVQFWCLLLLKRILLLVDFSEVLLYAFDREWQPGLIFAVLFWHGMRGKARWTLLKRFRPRSDTAEKIGLRDHRAGRLLAILRNLIASLLQQLEHRLLTGQSFPLLLLELLLDSVFAIDHLFQVVEDA